MDRIKKTHFLIPFCICIALFFVPFFWFQPGQVNLGGDSSRLYFYDPYNYLTHNLLYDIVPSDVGNQNISYSFIPFTAFLLLLKTLVINTSLVINVFHGFELASAFLFMYLTVYELLLNDKNKNHRSTLLAAIGGGFLYIFNPILAQSWDTAVISQNQFFLNPMLFYLLLKYFHVNDKKYLFSILFISFIFSSNFGYASAPALFSFYPIAGLFIIVYTYLILKKRIEWGSLLLFLILFIGINAFHIIPQIVQILDKSSAQSQNVFSAISKSSAQNYFLSVSADVRLTNNFLSINQNSQNKFSLIEYGSFVFLFIIILGYYFYASYNKIKKMDKTYILLGFFLLFVLFLDSANITSYGSKIYMLFYRIPGFEMFRNFYGQFVYVLFFFYTICFAFGLNYCLIWIRPKYRFIFYGLLIFYLFIVGIPVIKGDIPNRIFYKTKNITVPFIMDKKFEEFLDAFRNIPIDGKVVTFPLSSYGYQMLGGTKGGIYKGPSMIGYLTGKKDFTGYGHFAPFDNLFLLFISEKNYSGLNELFALFNVRYLFHDSDSYIYDKFIYPYDQLKDSEYFPNQKAIVDLINNLGVNSLMKNGIYSLYNTTVYFPHIYSPKTEYLTGLEGVQFLLSSPNLDHPYAIDIQDDQRFILSAIPFDIYPQIIKFYPFPVQYPFVKWELDSPFYRFALLKESYRIYSFRNDDLGYIDTNLFFASKRISELSKWGMSIPIDNGYLSFSQLRDTQKITYKNALLTNNNSWEVSLDRYFYLANEAINRINSSNESSVWKTQERYIVKGELIDHRNQIYLAINTYIGENKSKKYLNHLVNDMFSQLFEKIKVSDYDIHTLEYTIKVNPQEKGRYKILVKKDVPNTVDMDSAFIMLDSKKIYPIDSDQNYINFGTIYLRGGEKDIKMYLPQVNITEHDQSWEKKDQLSQSLEAKVTTLSSLHGDNFAGGAIKKIQGLDPKSNYLLSFDYNTYGYAYEVSGILSESIFKKNTLSQNTLFREKTISFNWEKMNIFLDMKNYSSITILLRTTPGGDTSKIDIKNFRLYKIPNQPVVIFKNTEIPSQKYSPPTITFNKVNPTKYYIHIKKADKPYKLIFLDSYNDSWKLFLSNNSSEEHNIAAKYFNGLVNEGKNKNVFFDLHTFETLFKKQVSDKTHKQINGYANEWLISPVDVGGKDSYTLILEMTDQRIFYVSIFISSCSIVLAMLLFVNSMRKKNTGNTNRFGGERLDSKSSLARNNLLEHLARYNMVIGVKGGTVLDVGCGTGHGSNLLAKRFKKVKGIDISKDAIEYAKKNWKTDNTEFSVGSALDIPFKSNTFDAIAAFEIIEHLHEYDTFLSELKRVVKPNGKIYISTPNKDVYSPRSKTPINPHHVYEWKIDEFKNILKQYYSIEKFYGMRTPIYNDHWIWKIVDPILFTFYMIIPYTVNNRIKLTIINHIKPTLDKEDIIFSAQPQWVKKSRFMLAVCINRK